MTLLDSGSKRGKRSKVSGKLGVEVGLRGVNLEFVQLVLRDILGDTATTVVLKELFPDASWSARLGGKELEALRKGLEQFFGDAGLMLYDQVVKAVGEDQ